MYIQALFQILKLDKQYTDPTCTFDTTHHLATRGPTELRVATIKTFRLFTRDTLYKTYSTFLELKSRSKLLGWLFKVWTHHLCCLNCKPMSKWKTRFSQSRGSFMASILCLTADILYHCNDFMLLRRVGCLWKITNQTHACSNAPVGLCSQSHEQVARL